MFICPRRWAKQINLAQSEAARAQKTGWIADLQSIQWHRLSPVLQVIRRRMNLKSRNQSKLSILFLIIINRIINKSQPPSPPKKTGKTPK